MPVVYNAFHGDAGHVLPVLLPQHFCLHADVQHHPADSSARVALPSGGGLAQLGEHYVRNVGVAGSTPVPSTIVINGYTGPNSRL